MNLAKKKALAAKVFDVGKARIIFVKARLNEIKEAITKQDIRDLKGDGAILIREVKGRKTIKRTNKRRGPGNVKIKVNTRKRDYIIMTRKLRRQVNGFKSQGKISKEESVDLRKKIRNKFFKNKNHLREYVGGTRK